ncbi:echinoderm microtubule-associated protein-like 4 isoform X2 [Anguilla rostrata]|uniref:echinoderm microtubule-associated protein-like 4 isoform X2 n=1 Tax=Anguilla rostrata TaxID=7938 RepID=UPI0030D3E0C0
MENEDGMASAQEPGRSSVLDETSHSHALLAPEISFAMDDSVSAASGMDVSDRLSTLEQRVQMQEDELQMLKSVLADLLRRLSLSEERQANVTKKGAAKAKPMMQARSPGSTATSSTVLPKRPSTAPTPSCPRKTPSALATKNKQKEPVFTVGTRQVTHCKVTMQIYLSHLSKRTGSSEAPQMLTLLPVRPTSAPPKLKSPPDKVKIKAPALTLSLRKTSSQTGFTPLDTPGYKSPLKSPSQYFQICY